MIKGRSQIAAKYVLQTFAGLFVQNGAGRTECVAVQGRKAAAEDDGEENSGARAQGVAGDHKLVVRATGILPRAKGRASGCEQWGLT